MTVRMGTVKANGGEDMSWLLLAVIVAALSVLALFLGAVYLPTRPSGDKEGYWSCGGTRTS